MDASRSYEERSVVRGSLAEDKCVEYLDKRGFKYERMGFNGTKISTWKLPIWLRKLPEFLVEDQNTRQFFVECKGCGKEGILKIKCEDVEAVRFWQSVIPVKYFFYNSSFDSFVTMNLEELRDLTRNKITDRFWDNNELYYLIPTIDFEWRKL